MLTNLLGRGSSPLQFYLRKLSSNKWTDYYKVLNLKPSATHEEIKQAYFKLSKQCHPDISNDPESKKLFIQINEAFSVLGKIESRREYDANRKLISMGLAGYGYQIDYPKPSRAWDSATLEAYDNEMRRRWNERLLEWVCDRKEYEFERGILIESVENIQPPTSMSSIRDRETRLCVLIGSIGGLVISVLLIYRAYQ